MKARRIGRPPKHGRFHSKEYKTWSYIRAVCNNPSRQGYGKIGGAGLSHEPAWEDFEAFLKDMGNCPEGCSLKRRDTSKGFDKKNCFWKAVVSK